MFRVLVVLSAVTLTAAASAQVSRPKATLSPRVSLDPVPAGATMQLLLDVALPAGLHVQSNKPRDPSLIATSLTITPPAGVTVVETVYPRAVTFKLSGGSQDLDVFGDHFTVGVTLAVAETVADGGLVVSGRLRYQACNESSCFAPATESAQWTVHVKGRRP